MIRVLELSDLREAATTTDPARLDALALADDVRIRCLVAANPATLTATLRYLKDDVSIRVRTNVGGHSNTDAATLGELTCDVTQTVRRRVLRRDDLPDDALLAATDGPAWLRVGQAVRTRAATDTDFVRVLIGIGTAKALAFAANGALDETTIRALRVHEATNPGVAAALARNPTVPIPVVREVVAGNKNLAPHLVARLAGDRAGRRIALLKGDTAVLAVMAAKDDAPKRTLWAIWLRRPSRRVRRALAGQPAVPRWVAWRLTFSRHWDVRATVAVNPALGPRRLNRMAQVDRQWAVAVAAVCSERLSPRTLTALVSGHPGLQLQVAACAGTPRAAVEALLEPGRSPFVRAVALRHPALDPERLVELAADFTQPAWMLRSIAINPACPAECRDQLLTWLAIGGAPTSDPTFDPLTERGHPGLDLSEPLQGSALEMAADPAALRHPLTLVRARYFDHHQHLGADALTLLARDPVPEIRRRTARYQWRPTLKELADDAVPFVAREATRVATADPSKLKAPGLLTQPRVIVSALVAVGLVAGLGALTEHGRRSTPHDAQTGAIAEAGQSLCTLPKGASVYARWSGTDGTVDELVFTAGSVGLDVQLLDQDLAGRFEPDFVLSPAAAHTIELPRFLPVPAAGRSIGGIVTEGNVTRAFRADFPPADTLTLHDLGTCA